ncbi:MAG: anion permease [Enterobacteriaceae bacterium]
MTPRQVNGCTERFSSGTTWLVFSAFAERRFCHHRIRKRLAYWFILKFGGTTLRLGYVTALLDLMLCRRHL